MQVINPKNRKIKVCFFTTVQQPNNVRLFHRECRSLVKAGFDVHLVVPCESSQLKEGVQIHAIRRSRNRFLRMTLMPWIAMRKALRTNAQIYHFHDPELLIIGFLMRWVFFKKVVFDMRESTARQLKSKGYLPHWSRSMISFCYRIIETISLKGIALIVANDRSTEEYKNCYLVRNFPETDKRLMANALDMKKRLEKPLLVYVGGVWKSRGALLYIELARQLVEKGNNFHLMIIGQYEEQFGQKLKAKIRNLNLQDKITLTGFIDYQDAMKLVSQAVIGLAILEPTPNYTFCLAGKMLEYMMCGTPVLCSNFEHWRPYIEGEKTGIMVDPDNMEQIVSACQNMLDNPDELAAMSKRSMKAVRSKYNWEKEFKNLLKCYDDLLKK